MTAEQQQVHKLLSSLPDKELIGLAVEFGAALDVRDGRVNNRAMLIEAMTTGGCPGCGKTKVEKDVAGAFDVTEPYVNKKGKVIRYFDQHSHSYKHKIVILNP